jgi:hypothetical protein
LKAENIILQLENIEDTGVSKVVLLFSDLYISSGFTSIEFPVRITPFYFDFSFINYFCT